MIKAVFFDLYGTLFLYGDMKQGWTVWLDAFYSCLREIGLSVSKEEFTTACDQFLGRAEPQNPIAEFSLLENRIYEFARDFKLTASKDEVKNTAEALVNSWQDFIDIDPHTKHVLETLKQKYILGLVSNFDHPAHVRKCLKEEGIDILFDTIVVSAEVGTKKPDPAVFDRALKETGIQPHEVVYVGDTAGDMKAAEAAGMEFVLIRRQVRGTDESALDFSSKEAGNTKKSETHARSISSLDELIPFIQRLSS